MSSPTPYDEFVMRLKDLSRRHPTLIAITLGNVFSMRLLGNKTHGDLAEIALVEFVNQYMPGYRATHVGKALYRVKTREEDVRIVHVATQTAFTISLKAYGEGPLQLSTDKSSAMFTRLERVGADIRDPQEIQTIFSDPAFAPFSSLNVLPLIYNKTTQQCNILVFDSTRARSSTRRIALVQAGLGRKHPVYRFYEQGNNEVDGYICEVRYGGATANALQRGLWTHTKHAHRYFDSVTGGWISYAHNESLIGLISQSLVASETGHAAALVRVQEDLEELRVGAGISP